MTLGRFFTYDVTIQPGHRVVTSGPYRWVRHPSYTGGLLGLLGLGVALGSGAAVLALVVVPLIELLIRSERSAWPWARSMTPCGSSVGPGPASIVPLPNDPTTGRG